jgi:hypothetical protein
VQAEAQRARPAPSSRSRRARANALPGGALREAIEICNDTLRIDQNYAFVPLHLRGLSHWAAVELRAGRPT